MDKFFYKFAELVNSLRKSKVFNLIILILIVTALLSSKNVLDVIGNIAASIIVIVIVILDKDAICGDDMIKRLRYDNIVVDVLILMIIILIISLIANIFI